MGVDILNAAKEYTKRGWIVHPLSSPHDLGKSPGKRPLEPSWQSRKQATEIELNIWFTNTNNNPGLVAGKGSGVLVVDLDKMDWLGALFPSEDGLLSSVLMSGRISGRGHLYFKYTDDVKSQKLHDFGIEILSDGNNVVLPPGIHAEGQQYKWKNPDAPLTSFPKIAKKNLGLLKSLSSKLKDCRPCFRYVVTQSNDAMHGTEGRRLMLATCTELKANHVTLEEAQLYARKVYVDEYDSQRTKDEWKTVDEKKTWKCQTIAEEFPDLAKLCSSCSRKQIDKDYIDVATKEKALLVLEKSNPVDYILETWNKIHVGDISFGFVLLCSALSASVQNSDGIQINFNGDSGGGKSHACRSMLHLIPRKHWSKKSVSNKALFYSNSIKPGMILFSDDVILSDDLKMIYKNSVSDFQEEIEHETVDVQRKAQTLRVASRLTWWLTSVTDPGNQEIERRNLKIVIDVNKERSKTISARLMERKCLGEAKYPEYPEVFICRAIFDKIKSEIERVFIPYTITFNESVGLDTQNIVYELIYSVTLINKYKRHRTSDGAIISDKEDFNLVIKHFSKISDTQISKLTKGELDVARYIKQYCSSRNGSIGLSVTSDILQERFGKSKGWVSQILNGRNGDGGLLQKMSNIVEDDITKKDETETIRKKEYRFVGRWDELSIYDAVAVIEE